MAKMDQNMAQGNDTSCKKKAGKMSLKGGLQKTFLKIVALSCLLVMYKERFVCFLKGFGFLTLKH